MTGLNFKAVLGIVILCLMATHGIYSLTEWYSTGKLWTNFRSRGEPNNYQLITYDELAVRFIVNFSVHQLYIGIGCTVFILSSRRWLPWLRRKIGERK